VSAQRVKRLEATPAPGLAQTKSQRYPAVQTSRSQLTHHGKLQVILKDVFFSYFRVTQYFGIILTNMAALTLEHDTPLAL